MLTLVRVLSVLLTIAVLSFGQTAKRTSATAVKPTTAQKSAYKAAAPKATAIRSTAVPRSSYRAQAPAASRIQASRVTRTPAARATARRYYAPPRPAVQMQPSQDRYREIQQALIDKGYLQGTATGTWDADSIAAWNRFKQDQKQRADGRLDARSLIALGLGPKKESYISVPTTAVTTEQAVGSQEQQ